MEAEVFQAVSLTSCGVSACMRGAHGSCCMFRTQAAGKLQNATRQPEMSWTYMSFNFLSIAGSEIFYYGQIFLNPHIQLYKPYKNSDPV